MTIIDPFYAAMGALIIVVSGIIAATSNDRNGTLPMALFALAFGSATLSQGLVLP